jgi:outer membrane protein TolC
MSSPTESSPPSAIRPRALAPGILLVAFCAACAAPRRAPLCDARIAASVLGRAGSAAELEAALALADLGPLAVPRPSSPAEMDPANPGFWYACAYLYEPSVRQARRRVEALRARAKGAGAVPSIDATGEHVRNDSDRETEVMATVDLLSLLGLGPSAAARELARAEVCEALGELESAVWAAYFKVMRARIRHAAALEREQAAAAIVSEAHEDETRIATLESAGRGAASEFAWARAGLQQVEEERARARIEAADALEELALATGLRPDHPAMARLLTPFRLGELESGGVTTFHVEAVTEPVLLLARVPALRAAKLRYAVAEARVREAAAATWPGLEIGPKATLVPDDFLGGGIMMLRLPLPGATVPGLCAAIVERTAARERLEDELSAAVTKNQVLNRKARELWDEVRRRVRVRRSAAEQMWTAARTRFRADQSTLSGWVLALEMRLETALSAIATGEAVALIETDIQEASGPGPGLFPESAPAETRPR